MKTINDFKGTKGEFKYFQYSPLTFRIIGAPIMRLADINADIREREGISVEEAEANAKLFAASKDLLKELIHLVRLLEPLEQSGKLDVPGLATLNGARKAIEKAL